MNCQKCDSKRILSVCAKCSDMFSATIEVNGKGIDYNGYVPTDIGMKDKFGDYVEFDYCLSCGQIQGKFPIGKTKIEKGAV